ncbi:MAG: 2-oxoacid:ferredoxin oxidoreductase subunit beta [Crocinitomicaceae bacterium]|nr:2-oxoacid:ferredoxin oxidoreductase subunit beta [Crocinitomicaceae bacterium]
MESTQLKCSLSARDFASNQQVKWCPGCGDYAVLSAVQKTLADLGIQKENVAFVSGIGCSSRFPYYMSTYGFHTIHGRASAVASGLKIANPDLSVWIISGDGDSLAIGGNHFIHVIRRNMNMNLILFNNEIYGLTKGQYSPTTKKGHVTKSSPHGTIENPFIPGELALGAGAKFYARVPDTNVKLMTQVFTDAEKHNGFSLVEVLQNCVIFNDDVHLAITGKESKDENQLILEHGKPMLFGKESKKGIRLNGLRLEVVTLGENGISEKDILVHDALNPDPTLHAMLVRMKLPDFPVAMGIIRNVEADVYNDLLTEQIDQEKQKSKFRSPDDLFRSGNTFKVG